MLFLIEYDSAQEQLVTFATFQDKEKAHQARIGLELAGSRNEIVTLEAASEEIVRKTHARYFKTLPELVRSFAAGGVR